MKCVLWFKGNQSATIEPMVSVCGFFLLFDMKQRIDCNAGYNTKTIDCNVGYYQKLTEMWDITQEICFCNTGYLHTVQCVKITGTLFKLSNWNISQKFSKLKTHLMEYPLVVASKYITV